MLVLLLGSASLAQEPGSSDSAGGTDLDVPTGLREGAGGQPTAAEAPGPPNAEDLSIPSGLREDTGGAPTGEMEEEGKAPPFEGPGWLDKALGLGESSIHVHGWIQNTFTGNTNGTPPSGRNFALYPNYLANQWMGNQYYLVFERPLEQIDRINVGFRIDALFGYDWQATKEYGFFDNAFTPNSFTGFDLPQAYGEVHLPVLTRGGLDLKFGRWYSIAGYEQVPAVRRPCSRGRTSSRTFPSRSAG